MYLSCFDAVNLKEGEVCPAARQRGAEEKIYHAKHNRMGWLVGVAVSTTDSESVDRGSNPRRAWQCRQRVTQCLVPNILLDRGLF